MIYKSMALVDKSIQLEGLTGNYRRQRKTLDLQDGI